MSAAVRRVGCNKKPLLLGCGCLGCPLGFLVSLLGLSLLLTVVGVTYQSIGEARDRRQHPPPDQMVDVGRHRLHLYCTGALAEAEDAPTVILDAGLGGYSHDWVWVQPQVAEFARVCSYDRAGYAWSDPGPMPRDSQHVVADLQTLLTGADVPSPYVLVGHSFGGLNARLYAKQHPEQIVGVVLVDATPENVYDDPAFAAQWEGDRGEVLLFRTVAILSRSGALRLFVQLAGTEPLTFLRDYPLHLHDDILAIAFLRTLYYETVVAELETFEQSTRQVQAAGADPDRPYVVIARRLLEEQDGPDADPAQEEAWRRLQTELAESLPQGVFVIAERSDHLVHMQQPDLVVEAIRQVVEAASD
ncbi:MAG TPA: alpha/beta hydrolase [Chloroflexi bacterium]|nr:alpha/beta hydrolase [Chloroflexota bacterium]